MCDVRKCDGDVRMLVLMCDVRMCYGVWYCDGMCDGA